MPIAQTTVAAGDLITHAIVTGNLQALEAYMLGKVPAADLVNLIRKRSGLNDQEHLVWASVPFESGLGIETRSDWDATGNPAIDKTSIIDFLYRGKPLKGQGDQAFAGDDYGFTLGWATSGTAGFAEIDDGPVQHFLHERMGSFPLAENPPDLVNSPFSMYDWRYTGAGGLPTVPQAVSASPLSLGKKKDRFPEGEIWELWKTVPYASMVIYVPEPCRLYVNAVARGTWNLCVMGGGASPAETNWNLLNEMKDPPTVFRLFISKNPSSIGSVGDNVFTWNSGIYPFVANWSPIQPLDTEPNVAYGELSKSGGDASKKFNVGREWMASTWPRGIIRVASEIYVPKAGYYTVALKFNTLHWFGVFNAAGDFTKRYMNILGDGGDGKKISTGGGQDITYGPSLVCRWEAAAISATAQRKRTGSASDYTSVQFP